MKKFLLSEIKSITYKNVNTSESLIKSGLLSSITVVDLVVSIEEKFSVKIPFSEITKDNFDNVDLILKFLNGKGIGV